DKALRKAAADIIDLLAHLVPDIADHARRRTVLQVEKDCRLAGRRIAADVIEIRRLLQLLLDAVGDLQQRVIDGSARPRCLHHHSLDAEGSVLLPAEPQIRNYARRHDDDHKKPNERLAADRPVREVERSLHGVAVENFTFWPGRSACTPAVTTMSPSSIPCATITKLAS